MRQRWAALALTATVTLSQAPTQALAENAGDIPAAPDTWSSALWDAAQSGQTNRFTDLLEAAPTVGGLDQLSRDLLDAFDNREADRAEQIAEISGELDEEFNTLDDAGNRSDLTLSQALVSAIGMQMLMDDNDKFFSDPRVVTLMREGEQAARAAEARGDWLMANELFYRLDTLTEDAGEFADDTSRVSNRLNMLALYTPERFWQLRNDRRALEDLDPLPRFNGTGQDYNEKLAGISAPGVIRAIDRSADQWVQRERGVLAQLIGGGFDAVRTMATTTDLHPVLGRLADDSRRDRFLELLDQQADRYANNPLLGRSELRSALNALMTINAQTVAVPEEALLHEFGNGAMDTLDDYSAIIWPDELRRFQRSTQGQFVGVGIQIQMDEQYNIKVVTPIEGTPAQRAGIRTDDVIRKVNGESTAGFTLDQAVELITGPRNTTVTLTIEREVPQETDESDTDQPADQTAELAEADGEAAPEPEPVTITRDYPLVRESIKIGNVKGWERELIGEEKWNWFVDPDRNIGYLRITGFSPGMTDDVDKAVNEMKAEGLNGLIVDLRYNPGGLLDEAVELTNRIVPSGWIVRTEYADGRIADERRARSSRATIDDIPVVILINNGSASASEIVSGAVQHYDQTGKADAIVLGERSFGKGSVQNVWGLPGNTSAQKLTTQYYRLPSGRIIHREPGSAEWGVDPDLEIPMLPEQYADSIRLRIEADVIQLDENGNVLEGDEPRPDPNTLLSEGTDLQLKTALTLLQSRVSAASPIAGRTGVEPAGVQN